MKKIVQRTKGFEKAFLKLEPKWRQKFIKQLGIFLVDEFDPILKTHRLKGKRNDRFSFSVAFDIRALYTKTVVDQKEMIIFTFIDIGSHSRVYN